MKILVVFAHPEPKSFGSALLERAKATLVREGHEVAVSDLYRMGFNPVASEADFTERRFPEALQYDREQKYSVEHASLSPDIQTELEKLQWCDLLILQFPLWWFSVPAIMKGWIDRVFVNGVVYGKGRRLDTGGMKGRRAMLALSTGCYPDMVAPDGMLGGLDINLWHLQAGTLAYAGFEVLPPFVAWSIHYCDSARLGQYLDEYEARLRGLATTEPLFFHPQSDFENWRLRPGLEPRAPGQRRVPAAS
jgi:NAD(P)H dehydrogenase (quinone)